MRLDPHEVMEELQGLRVAPLQIIGDEQQGSSRRVDGPSGGFEQPPPLLGIGSGLRQDGSERETG